MEWTWTCGDPGMKSSRSKEVAPKVDNNKNRELSKREVLDNKMLERELVAQRGSNPFSVSSDYVKDIMNQDTFLRGMNSSTLDKTA